jgi:hypothetical protein
VGRPSRVPWRGEGMRSPRPNRRGYVSWRLDVSSVARSSRHVAAPLILFARPQKRAPFLSVIP